MATTSEHAGKRLRTWLKTERVTVVELSAQLGVSRQSVYRWRRGERPPYEMMLKIQATTGITLAEWGLR